MQRIITRKDFLRLAAAVGGSALIGVSLTGCDAADRMLLHRQTVTDHAGRTLEVPTIEDIHSIFFTSGLAQVYITALCPELLGGSASKYTEEDLQFMPEGVENLPYMGTLHNNDEIDREALLVEDIDIMFSISGVGLTQQDISEADEIEEQTGIPVVCVDGTFDKIGDAFRFLGQVLDREERAEELALYCEGIWEEVHAVVQTIPESERIRLYYAEGPEGLQTEPETSQHMTAFLEAGAIDVALCEETYGGGMTDVSLEQVLKWDPAVIVAWDSELRGGAVEDIRTNPDWSTIQAVKDGRVYPMPNLPWAWCDRPPGVNRLMGLQWICNLLYPQYYDIDIVERAQQFFQVMLKVDVDRQLIIDMLDNSYNPAQDTPADRVDGESVSDLQEKGVEADLAGEGGPDSGDVEVDAAAESVEE